MDKLRVIISTDLAIPDCPRSLGLALEKDLTLANPAYNEAVKFRKYAGDISPTLECYTRELSGTLRIPRGFGFRFDRLARQNGIIPTYDDQRRILDPADMEFKGSLRDYQQEAVTVMLAKRSGILQAGTGAGKTVMALAIIAERKQPTMIVVHTKELLNQWVERIDQFLGIKAGIIGAGKFDIRPVTVATIQTSRNHLDKLVPRFGHIIIDECHRTPSSTFSEVVTAFDAMFVLGLSATPYRRDGLTKLINFFIGERLHCVNDNRLRKIGAILRPNVILRPTNFTFPDHLATEDYASMLEDLVNDPLRNQLIAHDVLLEVKRNAGTCLIVSDRTAHLEALRLTLMSQGQSVSVLSGKTPAKERKRIVEALAVGKIQVLASTTQLIGEGFDAPGLSSLFLTTPIRFSGRLVQVVGRILRPLAGKKPQIFDYVDSRVGVLENSARGRQQIYEQM